MSARIHLNLRIPCRGGLPRPAAETLLPFCDNPFGLHIWLHAVSASGLHQGAHENSIVSTVGGDWALVPPASGGHRAPLDALV